MDFEANKKYWYHKETGVTRYDDPAKEARKEADAEMLERKIRTKKRLLRMGRKRGEDEDEEYCFLASERRSRRSKAAVRAKGTGGRKDSDYRCSRSSWCRWCCSCSCWCCCCCCQQWWRRAVVLPLRRRVGACAAAVEEAAEETFLLFARRQHRLSTDMRRVAVFQAQIVAITAVS